MKLPVHYVQETLTLYRTRLMIAGMTKPMVAIVTAIKATKNKYEEAQRNLEELQAEGSRLDEKLQIDYVVPFRKSLKKPQRVCSDSGCGKPVLVDNISIVQYTKICHEECYIETAEETVGLQELTQCFAFGNKGQDCSVCGHPWSLHLHVSYELKYERRPNPAVHKALTENVEGSRSIEDTLMTIEEEMRQLDGANQLVQQSLAKFGIFLKHNAMVAFNDAIIKYLDYQYKNAMATGGVEQAKDFRDQKEVYQKQFDEIENAISCAEDKVPLKEDLEAIVKKLEAIPVYGEQLVQMQDGGAGVLDRPSPPSVELRLGKNGSNPKWIQDVSGRRSTATSAISRMRTKFWKAKAASSQSAEKEAMPGSWVEELAFDEYEPVQPRYTPGIYETVGTGTPWEDEVD